MKPHTLQRATFINRPVDEVFHFFSNPVNLARITPPAFRLRIITPQPVVIQQGTIIDYKIKALGIPFKWRTEITVWQPPHRFVDIQVHGPYSLWTHEHVFEAKDGGTLMHDRLQFRSPGWVLEPLINKLLVQPKIEELFDHREACLKKIFE